MYMQMDLHISVSIEFNRHHLVLVVDIYGRYLQNINIYH